MNPLTPVLAVLLAAALALPASARDERLKFPIAQAIEASSGAKTESQIDPEIKLFWGKQTHPTPSQTYGTFTSNKKTNFVNKTDQEGCNWAWLSAVNSLQDRARREGGNAVVNIRSLYKNEEFTSDTEYECGAGSIMGGVALRGTVVKLP